MRTHETAELSKTPLVRADDKEKVGLQKKSDATVHLCRLPVSPTAARYDDKFHKSSVPTSKVQQFDGKGNPKQQIGHFVETCENARSRGDQLVKQFVRSFKGNSFEWRVVSMMELMNTKQRKEEPVIDYLNRWRALNLNCKDKLTELSVVEMCTQASFVFLKKLRRCFFKFKFKGSKLYHSKMIIIFIFSHVLQSKGSSSLSSHMRCNREDNHLHLLTSVTAKKIMFIFSHMLQSRELSSSSSHMFYSREDHHLHLLTCVAVERFFIFIFSLVLQLRGSSSSSFYMCCSQEDRHLHLQCVVSERIIIFIFDPNC
ncbi:ty3-gypsy retrotransposon protein [Cucumis melo var. makuwa]|uniref:Ty3-gypsy retrotransposon protein n=1 Tax=Cucumis melo var. makuwa TaxID=1194695 RepID=A0A5A7SWZ9_CUCMM|nr:ty3-gypsy retrotransposon protein [Cucumis melo var. makuwa]